MFHISVYVNCISNLDHSLTITVVCLDIEIFLKALKADLFKGYTCISFSFDWERYTLLLVLHIHFVLR